MFKAKEAISKNIGREILLLPPLQMASLKAPTLPVAKFDTHQVGQGVVYNVIVYDGDIWGYWLNYHSLLGNLYP